MMRIVAALAALFFAEFAVADTIELSRGVQVDGRIIKQVDEGQVPHLIVDLDPTLKIAIPKSRVRKTILDADLKDYSDLVSAAGDDADAHFELAKKCVQMRLTAQSDYHFRRAVELNPDHAPARRALGYVREGNKWILYADLQRQRGIISVGGQWTIPEVYAREKRREEAEDAAKQWVREFARLRTMVMRGDKQSAEALQSIQAIEDPLAGQAFAGALVQSRGKNADNRELRKLYVKKLSGFNTRVAIQTLVETGLVEPDPIIRDLALEALQNYGAPSAVATYLAIVKNESSSPNDVQSALRALNSFPEPELWRDYVDALVTTHKKKIPKGAGMQAGFGGQGGSGLSTGGKDQIIVQKVQNAAARELLRTIAEGVDFGYDQMAWRKYFADQLMQTPGDLRRDP